MFPGMSKPWYPEYSNHQVAPINTTNSSSLFGDELYDSDEFRMYRFKIDKCPRKHRHDWTLCPFAHRGEVATRRHPIRYKYEAVSCLHYGDGVCPRGKHCTFAHGLFEYYLHPTMYRTSMCIYKPPCHRKVCFFAHSDEELRDKSMAKDLHMHRLEVNGLRNEVRSMPDSLEGSASNTVAFETSMAARNRYVGETSMVATNSNVGETSMVATNSNVGETSMVATNSNVGSEGRNDFLASLSGLTISENDERRLRVYGATHGNVGSEGRNDFLASLSGLTITENDERRLHHFGATHRNDGREGRNDFLASLSGLTISENDERRLRLYGEPNIDWIAELL